MTTLTQEFTLGEPRLAGPLVVFPVFGPSPRLSYRLLVEALSLGAFVKELDGGAVVGSLLVENPTGLPLLIYEGEEVLGAQQNRTFDVSVLVAASSRAVVPVSCVERGRWDSTRYGERFVSAAHTADPSLRRAKWRAADGLALAGLEPRANQGEVWEIVDSRLSSLGVASPSAAMSDAFDAHLTNLDSVADTITAREGQVGAIAQTSDRVLVLDLVSRPHAFASLLPRLARGYALDALGGADARPDAAAAELLLSSALSARRQTLPTPGEGHAFRIFGEALLGAGLEDEGELIQLCAFPGEAGSAAIAQPTRRLRLM